MPWSESPTEPTPVTAKPKLPSRRGSKDSSDKTRRPKREELDSRPKMTGSDSSII